MCRNIYNLRPGNMLRFGLIQYKDALSQPYSGLVYVTIYNCDFLGQLFDWEEPELRLTTLSYLGYIWKQPSSLALMYRISCNLDMVSVLKCSCKLLFNTITEWMNPSGLSELTKAQLVRESIRSRIRSCRDRMFDRGELVRYTLTISDSVSMSDSESDLDLIESD